MTTISATGKAEPAGHTPGFTLLEIVLVVMILTLAVGLSVPFFSDYLNEERLREPARELELFARTARSNAVITGKATRIIFDPDGFQLVVASPPAVEDEEFAEPDSEEEAEYAHRLAGDIKIEFLSWLDQKWRVPEDAHWVFQPTGVCEPITVRLSRGDSWIELDFNPLTAEVQEEAFYFP